MLLLLATLLLPLMPPPLLPMTPLGKPGRGLAVLAASVRAKQPSRLFIPPVALVPQSHDLFSVLKTSLVNATS
jgi:hypothetical protein